MKAKLRGKVETEEEDCARVGHDARHDFDAHVHAMDNEEGSKPDHQSEQYLTQVLANRATIFTLHVANLKQKTSTSKAPTMSDLLNVRRSQSAKQRRKKIVSQSNTPQHPFADNV